MAKKSQPSKGGSWERDHSKPKDSQIGDSKESMNEQRKAAEIPPKTGSGSSSEKSKD